MKYFNYATLIIIMLLYHIKVFTIEIKIIAKVNNQIITNIDLESRLNLALAISNIPNEAEVKQRLREQILKTLIDETLKIQEAQKFGILISSADLTTEINRLEQRLNIESNTLVASLLNENVSETTIYEQLRSQLLWDRLISVSISNSITITEKEKEEIFQNFIKNSGEPEYNLSEIFISKSNNNNSVIEKVNSIYSKLNTSNFISIAEQFSDGAVNIGNWTRESKLSERILDYVKKIKVGDITQPLESSIGYHIYLLNDKRKTKKIIQNQLLYNLSQIFFKFSDNKKSEVKLYTNLIADLRKSTIDCNNLDKAIKNTKKSSGGKLGTLPGDSLEPIFYKVIKKGLKVGELSEIIITEQGLHSLMLCEPIIKVTHENIKNNIANRLRQNKIINKANLLLNRIRQNALIEITSYK